jgi:hypothetical protein
MKKIAQLGIVKSIMVHLNLKDEGKLGSFFQRELKKLRSKIKAATQSIAILEFNASTQLEELKDALEDAIQAKRDAFMNVDPKDVATNAMQNDYSSVFWGGVIEAENNLDYIEKQIEELEDKLSSDIAVQKDLIEIFELRIESIEAQ